MRNWNFLKNHWHNKSVAVVFRLPMRNWNWWSNGHSGTGCWFLDCLWGIETVVSSNHGKKDAVVFRLPMRNWNACVHSVGFAVSDVFRLPMRNWNSVGTGKAAIQAEFLDCLWGIETRYRWRWRRWWCCVFRLPMRNWNLAESCGSVFWFSMFLDCLWGIETLILLFWQRCLLRF